MTAVSLDHPPVLDRQSFHAGRLIFKEGSEGNCAYVLQSGTVDIVRETDAGRVVLGRLTAGSIFGEMALIDDAPRMASAIAVDACTVIVIKREMLKKKIEEADPFVAKLLMLLVRNVRNVTDAHVDGKSLAPWLDGEKLDLDYEPEQISSMLAQGPFLRRDKK